MSNHSKNQIKSFTIKNYQQLFSNNHLKAVEFLSEWSLYPENEVFQRIYAGITNPELIGDKAKWFSNLLPQIYFPVWSKSTGSLIELVLSWAAQNQSAELNGSAGCTLDPARASQTRKFTQTDRAMCKSSLNGFENLRWP